MIDKDTNLYSRLYNWKFEQANNVLIEEPIKLERPEFDLITSLALMFGNVGHFTGDMGTIINAALKSIGVTDENTKIH